MNFSVVDLFAGCGGLSEGFQKSGFEVIAQVEMDKWACETLKTRNLYFRLLQRGNRYLYAKFLREEISRCDIFDKYPEIEQMSSYTVIQREFGKEKFAGILSKIEKTRKFYGVPKYHVVIGGPPCQPYSLIGRARDIYGMQKDNRHFLYEYYFKILESLQPDFFVFENVPGLISAKVKGQKIFMQLLDYLRNISPAYEIAPSFAEYSINPRRFLFECIRYGIPQTRKRLFIIAYRKSLLARNADLKNIFHKILKVKIPEYRGYTVRDAISDLPRLKPGEGSDAWLGRYIKEPLSPYQQKMRRNSPGILNHRARTQMKSDLKRYWFFIEHYRKRNKAATLIDLMNERPELTPAHNNLDGFLDRFKVQWWGVPASTVTAHISKYGHYYIHPDIKQCRSFTVREAARCQSFPDNFKFEGPRTEQFKQVGNAVPPRLANVIARFILKELKKIYE